MMRKVTFLLLLLFSVALWADDTSPPQPSGPQVAPNIVIQPDQQTQSLIGKWFAPQASFQYFHAYEKIILFKIPSHDTH